MTCYLTYYTDNGFGPLAYRYCSTKQEAQKMSKELVKRAPLSVPVILKTQGRGK